MSFENSRSRVQSKATRSFFSNDVLPNASDLEDSVSDDWLAAREPFLSGG
jgi:hypothetical protein